MNDLSFLVSKNYSSLKPYIKIVSLKSLLIKLAGFIVLRD